MIYNSMPRKKKEPTATDIAIGGSIFTNVNNVRTEFLVVHKGNPDASLYDSSCDGVWLLMKDCYKTSIWNNQLYNIYTNSYLNKEFNDADYLSLDTAVKNIIKQVKIPYCVGDGKKTINSGTNGLSCKVFALSIIETGLTSSTGPTEIEANIDGAKLDYFESGTGTSSNDKRKANYNNSVVNWWLRSPMVYDSSDYDTVYYISTNGQAYYTSSLNNADYGYRPCFIIPHDTKLDANNNIVV